MAKLTKNEKIEKAKVLAETLKQAPHLFFTDYKGLKFVEIDELRSKLRPLRCKYAVVKNSLIKYALKNAGVDGVDPKLLEGPIGLIVANDDDPVAPAKVISAIAKQFPNLKVKAGFISQKWMTPGDCEKLSKLPSKQELYGKAIGLVYAVVSQSVALAQAPTRDALLLAAAFAEKKKSESGAAAA